METDIDKAKHWKYHNQHTSEQTKGQNSHTYYIFLGQQSVQEIYK